MRELPRSAVSSAAMIPVDVAAKRRRSLLQMRRVGWSLVAASVLTAAILVVVLRLAGNQ